MEQCKICGRHKKQSLRSFEISLEPFEEDRELSHFLYRLTQDIINTKNFSDDNINRICEKHLRNSHYPDRRRLDEVVEDLKTKLRINPKEAQPTTADSNSGEPTHLNNGKTLDLNNVRQTNDKNISTQSFINVPKLMLKDPPSSISTITTYEFPSAEEPAVDPLQILITTAPGHSGMSPASSTTLQSIFLKANHKEKGEHISIVQPVDSSVDALTRMVAAGRNPESGCRRCPLGKCSHRKVHGSEARNLYKKKCTVVPPVQLSIFK
uniref:Uncharacterized protein n=1 Tax=Anopheles minimus TaxID=112268 RepID=A0A182VSB0_9DIPT